MKKRFLCIYFPNWAVELVQRTLPLHALHEGILLVQKVNNQLAILRQCNKARRLGIKDGSSLALAQAFLPNATIKDFDPYSDFKALYRLCTRCHKFSPLNGLDTETIEAYKQKQLHKVDVRFYGINLDITGTERVHKGELELIRVLNEKFARARFETRISVAHTLGAAWAFSRYIPGKVFVSHLESFISEIGSLPVEALRLPDSVAESMRDVGIKYVHQLLEIPRKAIAKRYGTKTLQRIDQAFGDEPERITPVPMPNHWAVFREFDYAINNHEQIVDLVLEMIDELVKKLTEKGRRARYFILLLQGNDLWGAPYRYQKDFSILIASANGSHIKHILFPLIERVSLPGPVYLLGLSTNNTEKLETAQTDLYGNVKRETEAQELLNQLTSEVGVNNVKEVSFSNSFLPETSFSFSPIGYSAPSACLDSKIRSRPSRLFEVPEEITAIAMLPDSPPVRINWKGEELKVRKGFGPERITIPWISCEPNDLVSRDYYRIEDEQGRWLWIFRNTETFKWFIQGVWM